MTSTATAAPADSGVPEPPPTPRLRRDLPRWFFPATIGVLVVAGIALRFFARQALWLDEAQSVAIAKLPLTGPATTLWDGLRQDGSPPLYYLLLHLWTELFGTGTAVGGGLLAVLHPAGVYPPVLLGPPRVGGGAAPGGGFP